MSLEENKALVRRFLDGIWNYEKLATFEQLLTPDYVFHDPVGETRGVGAFRDAVAEELEAISGVIVTVREVVAENDCVAVRYTSSFLQHGEFMGAYPIDGIGQVAGGSLHRIVDGKIAETWDTYDRRTQLRDRGAGQSLPEADLAAIRASVQEALRIGFADRPALAAHYWAESAEVVASNGETLRGRQAILDWLKRFPPVSEWTLGDLEIDGAGELAYVRGTYSMKLTGRAKIPFDRGKYIEVWRKQSDRSWKVVRHVYNSEVAAKARARQPQQVAHA